jgi:hypothetical protein
MVAAICQSHVGASRELYFLQRRALNNERLEFRISDRTGTSWRTCDAHQTSNNNKHVIDVPLEVPIMFATSAFCFSARDTQYLYDDGKLSASGSCSCMYKQSNDRLMSRHVSAKRGRPNGSRLL